MAKRITPNTKPKADTDFVNDLWKADNELRGSISENQYKDYGLSLLFLKHLSDSYKIRKKEIKQFFSDHESDCYKIDQKEQSYGLDDELEYQVKNVYRLHREATWTCLRENAEQDDKKVKVDKAFVQIEELLAERKPAFTGLMEPILVKSQLSPTRWRASSTCSLRTSSPRSRPQKAKSKAGCTNEYSSVKFPWPKAPAQAVLYVGICGAHARENDRSVKSSIMDLACGTGILFIQSLNFVLAKGANKNINKFFFHYTLNHFYGN